LPLAQTDYAENIYWVFGLVAESQELCEATCAKLSKAQIGTRPFFWCMHEQPVFQKMGLFSNETYPNAEKIARNGFYVPSGLGLTNEDLAKHPSFLFKFTFRNSKI
jgi:perosamine synthetase